MARKRKLFNSPELSKLTVNKKYIYIKEPKQLNSIKKTTKFFNFILFYFIFRFRLELAVGNVSSTSRNAFLIDRRRFAAYLSPSL